MGRKKSVAALQAEALKLQAQLDQAKREERNQERKHQAKIEAIIGRLLFAEFEAEPEGELARKVRGLAVSQLVLKTERALLGLEPLPEKKKARRSGKKTGEGAASPDDSRSETVEAVSDDGALKNLFGGKDKGVSSGQ